MGWRVWRWRMRPLPFVIAAMALLLAVKLDRVVQEFGGASAALGSAGRAVVPAAQAASGAKPTPTAAQPAPPRTPAQTTPMPTLPAAAANPAPVAEPVISDAERTILLDLRARRDLLEAREQGLAGRESVLAAAEKRLSERVDQLQGLQVRLEQMDAARRGRDEANWRGLVKTYETMRPRDAAAILNDMEMPVLLEVMDRMKEAKAALVLAAMLPDRARAATSQLAQMRNKQVAPPTVASVPGPQG